MMITPAQPSRSPSLVAATALGALVLASAAVACSSGSSHHFGDATAPSTTTTTTVAPSTSAASGATTTSTSTAGPDAVTIANFAFGPKTLTVKAGSTVTWKNTDQFAHWVKSTAGDPGVAFDLGSQATGQTVSHRFTAAGTYHYYCNIHNYMTGTIVVTP
jgi:plastocyanin